MAEINHVVAANIVAKHALIQNINYFDQGNFIYKSLIQAFSQYFYNFGKYTFIIFFVPLNK